jgi:anthranilate/para-aminobenzoate synthase component II
MRVRLIDHYDSFTFNVIGWLEGDPDVEVERLAFDDDRAMERAQADSLSWPEAAR